MTDWSKKFSEVTRRSASMGAESPSGNISVARVAGIDKLSKPQIAALAAAAKKIGVPVDWLATVMSFETGGTFSPSVLNKAGSGAFGLIQFMPSTAQNLLKTATPQEAVEKGRAMSFEQQLKDMVIPYFSGGTYKDLDALYLRVFYPAAANKPPDHVVATAPSAIYTQNQGFDATGKGYITRSDITSRVTKVYDAASMLPRIDIGSAAGWGAVFFAMGVTMGALWWLSKNTTLLPLQVTSFLNKKVF